MFYYFNCYILFGLKNEKEK